MKKMILFGGSLVEFSTASLDEIQVLVDNFFGMKGARVEIDANDDEFGITIHRHYQEDRYDKFFCAYDDEKMICETDLFMLMGKDVPFRPMLVPFGYPCSIPISEFISVWRKNSKELGGWFPRSNKSITVEANNDYVKILYRL